MSVKKPQAAERPENGKFGWTEEEQARWERGEQTNLFKSLTKESKKEKRSRAQEDEEFKQELARLSASRPKQTESIQPPAGASPEAFSEAPAPAQPAARSLGERMRQKRQSGQTSEELAAAAAELAAARDATPAPTHAFLESRDAMPTLAPAVETPAKIATPNASPSTAAPAPKAVALFDFDGTLTGPGTIGLFFIAAAGPFKVLAHARDLMNDKKALKAGSMSFEETLARAGDWLLGDLTEEQMEAAGARVLRWLRWIPRGWNKKTVARLETLKQLGAHVELVSGSFPWVAQEAARDWGVGCLCSEWERGANGWALRRAMVETAKGERVEQLRAQWPAATILAFGNSFGDKHMLMKADEPWFVAKMNQAPEKISRAAIAALRA